MTLPFNQLGLFSPYDGMTEEQLAPLLRLKAHYDDGEGSDFMAIALRAYAGSGKTFTIKKMMGVIPSEHTVCATSFTDASVTSIGRALKAEYTPFTWYPPADAMKSMCEGAVKNGNGATITTATVNSLGHALIAHYLNTRKIQYDKRGLLKDTKYNDLAVEYFSSFHQDIVDNKTVFYELKRQTLNIIKYIQSNSCPFETEDELEEIWDVIHGVRGEAEERQTLQWARTILKMGAERAFGQMTVKGSSKPITCDPIISHDDQIWLPNYMNLKAPFLFDVMVMDELQNLAKSRALITARWTRPNGVLIGAGDPYQEIMGFSGVRVGAYGEWVDENNAEIFTLSKSFRFGQKIANRSIHIVPDLIGFNHKSQDLIEVVSEFPKTFPQSSACVCRTNYEIVERAIEFRLAGTPYHFQKKSVVSSYLLELKKIYEDYTSGRELNIQYTRADFVRFIDKRRVSLETWLKNTAHASADRIAENKSRHTVCRMIAERINGNTIPEMLENASLAFDIDSKEGVCLITAHLSQGLEFKHVYLEWQRFMDQEEAMRSRQSWQCEAETFVQYVAQTRAIDCMYYVGVAPADDSMTIEGGIVTNVPTIGTFTIQALPSPVAE